MSVTGIVENDTIKLPPGVHVPDGTKAEIVFTIEQTATLWPVGFFEAIRIEDPAFSRPAQGEMADPLAELIGAFSGPRDQTGRKAEDGRST